MAQLQKKLFNRFQDKDKEQYSFRASKRMMNAIDQLGEYLGKSRSEVMLDCLEMYLQSYVEEGVIKVPDDDEPSDEKRS